MSQEAIDAACREQPLVIWLLTDEKPGHRNQLQGLLDALQRHAVMEPHWVSLVRSESSWVDILFKRYHRDLSKPGMVVGAGHGTHRDLLAIKRGLGAFAVVLMKPSLPLAWFDAAIVPRHDIQSTRRDHILLTYGVINTVTPHNQPDPHCGLILIGGESKHYRWRSAQVAEQVLTVVQSNPGIHWRLTDSRRTPDDFLLTLGASLPDNLSVTPHRETPRGWVADQMSRAAAIWVTPDSVSMIYEALTSGTPTGLFEMSPLRRGRILGGIQDLIDSEMVNSLKNVAEGFPMRPPAHPLWESERAARWLLKRYCLWRSGAE